MFYPFKKALVGLDLSSVDNDVVRYSFFIAQILPSIEELIFVHIAPPMVAEIAELSEARSMEVINEYIRQKISPYSAPRNVKTKIRVEQGDPLTQILEINKQEQIDVAFLGRKSTEDGSSLLAKRLTRRALCSIWCVPEKAKTEIKRLFMPVDFSSFSKMAMDYALAISQNTPIEIDLLHIYKPTTGRHVLQKSAEQMADVMEEGARLQYFDFMQQYDHLQIPMVTPLFAHDETRRLSEKICYMMAVEQNADLIMLGSRGRTEAAATLMGSFAEQLLGENATIPILILKGKRKNLNMMSAILRL